MARLRSLFSAPAGRLAGLWRACEGSAAVEAALVMPMLVFCMAGVVDGGRAVIQLLQVRAAAHAGADYAQQNGWDATAVETAVKNSTTLTVRTNPAPQLIYGCATNSGVTAYGGKGSTCPGGDTVGKYAIVTAESDFTTIGVMPSYVMPSKLTASAVVRLD